MLLGLRFSYYGSLIYVFVHLILIHVVHAYNLSDIVSGLPCSSRLDFQIWVKPTIIFGINSYKIEYCAIQGTCMCPLNTLVRCLIN